MKETCIVQKYLEKFMEHNEVPQRDIIEMLFQSWLWIIFGLNWAGLNWTGHVSPLFSFCLGPRNRLGHYTTNTTQQGR